MRTRLGTGRTLTQIAQAQGKSKAALRAVIETAITDSGRTGLLPPSSPRLATRTADGAGPGPGPGGPGLGRRGGFHP